MLNKKVYIYGCGGQGQESAALAVRAGYKVKGFIDDNYTIEEYEGFPVYKYQDIKINSNIIIGIGDPDIKNELYITLLQSGFTNFPTIIDPDAKVFNNAYIGTGAYICAGSIITTNVVIEKFVTININSTVSHRSHIGEFSNVAPSAAINGDCIIGKKCFIGSGAILKEKIKICDDTIIGAGSVVIKDIFIPGVYTGIPASFKNNKRGRLYGTIL